MQLSPELETVSCNNSGPESATITHVREGFLTWAILLNWCSLGWGMITESGLILLPSNRCFCCFESVAGSCKDVLSLCRNLEVERQRRKPWRLEFLVLTTAGPAGIRSDLTWAGILIQPKEAESLHVSHSRSSALICYWAAVRNLLFRVKVPMTSSYCRKEGENQQNWAWMTPRVL